MIDVWVTDVLSGCGWKVLKSNKKDKINIQTKTLSGYNFNLENISNETDAFVTECILCCSAFEASKYANLRIQEAGKHISDQECKCIIDDALELEERIRKMCYELSEKGF